MQMYGYCFSHPNIAYDNVVTFICVYCGFLKTILPATVVSSFTVAGWILE